MAAVGKSLNLLDGFSGLAWNTSEEGEEEQVHKDPPGAHPQGPGSGEGRAEHVISDLQTFSVRTEVLSLPWSCQRRILASVSLKETARDLP